MKRWFRRQSGARQTWIAIGAVVAVLLLIGAVAGEDDGGQAGTTAATTAASAETTSSTPAETTPTTATTPVEPVRPVAAPFVTAMREAGLPVRHVRDTSANCGARVSGCVERVTTDSVSVLAFATAGSARAYARTLRGAGRRAGTVVIAYPRAGVPRGTRALFAAALRAGDPQQVKHLVSAERARQRQVRERRARVRKRREAARLAAERVRQQEAAAAQPPAEETPAAAPDYSGLTCSEIGHSFNVAPGSDPDHDADGDGVACESE